MTSSRLPHLDNLRSAMVLGILVLHAVMAYNVAAPWWYAADPAKQPGFELIGFLLDSFPLPALFFLAGFFGPPSLERRGARAFVLGKCRRLGIPVVLISLTLLPVISWITLDSRHIHLPGLLRFWTTVAQDALLPKWQFVQSVPDYSTYGIHFSQYHLWFISLLLVFFLVSLPLLRARRNAQPDSAAQILLRLGGGCLAMVALMTALGSCMPVWSWINMGWLLFQPVRLPLYFGFFVLGIMAWRRGWLDSGSLPGPLWAWTLAALACTGAFIVITGAVMAAGTMPSVGTTAAVAAIRTGMCLAWMGMLLRIFGRWGRWSGRTAISLAASSYAIYQLHLPICVVAQWMLTPVDLAPALKSALVLGLSLLLPWMLHAAWRRDLSA